MQIESKTGRRMWLNSSLSLIPDVLIAAVIANLLSEGVLVFLLIFFILQILYLLIYVKKFIWSWLLFFISERKYIADNFYDYLCENDFPEPASLESSVESYLNSTLENSTLPIDTRLKAAYIVSALQMLTNTFQVSECMRVNLAYEDAIERYKRTLFDKKNR